MQERATRHIAIVGAGVAGLSLAYALAGRATVTVFEAGAVCGRGASSLPAALLNPYRGRTARAHPDDLAGLAAFWRRDDALRAAGHDSGAERSSVLRIASSERQAEDWRRAAAADGVRRLERSEIPPVYHAPHGGLLVPSGGWVRPCRLLAALAASARESGARILEHAPVESVERKGSTLVLATANASHAATHVVLCTGADPIPSGIAPGVAFERLAGDVIGLASSRPFAMPVAGAVYGVYAQATAWVGGNHRAPDAQDPNAPEALRRSFSWFVPSLREAPVVSRWTGVRAKTRGNRPLVREVSERVWVFGALAGRGFLCAAAEAERLAAELLAAR